MSQADHFNHGLPIVGEAVRCYYPYKTSVRRGESLRRRPLCHRSAKYETVGIFRSGFVLKVHEGKIPFHRWPEPGLADGEGNTCVRSCLVRDESSGKEGWVYEGALLFLSDKENRNAYLWERSETQEDPKTQELWTADYGQRVPVPPPKFLSRSFRKARQTQGMILKDLAAKTGFSFATIQQLENPSPNQQRGPIPLKMIAHIASVLKMTPLSAGGRAIQKAGAVWAGPPDIPQQWGDLPLGQESDCKIADDFDLEFRMVQKHRTRLGIPAYQGLRRNQKAPELDV